MRERQGRRGWCLLSLPIIRAVVLVGLGVCTGCHFLCCSNRKEGRGRGGLRLVTIQNLPSHACPLPLVREQRELIISLRPLQSLRLHQDMNGHTPDSCVHSQGGQTGPRRGELEESLSDQSGRKAAITSRKTDSLSGLFSVVSFLTAALQFLLRKKQEAFWCFCHFPVAEFHDGGE